MYSLFLVLSVGDSTSIGSIILAGLSILSVALGTRLPWASSSKEGTCSAMSALSSLNPSCMRYSALARKSSASSLMPWTISDILFCTTRARRHCCFGHAGQV
ncbi:hypothetical protein DFJ43DRAFT_1098320 [Lentinula guzmanii]|uniref:Uncharacterized protein n=1 Tax=Lentinula guzmanii TaxID=2804957 RepID=A0AA38JI54_9AGAR|nr:hypothetical protein DFJ43DRAFT_1098320 [Lentinula guzmanii]